MHYYSLKILKRVLTMLSENHRKKLLINLLDKTYLAESTVDDLISFFEPYEIEISNEKNRTTVYSSILYSKNVKQLWLNDKIETDEENSETKKTNGMKIPLNQIFYGPPGTGKTFKTPEIALEIINQSKQATIDRDEKFKRILEYINTKYTQPYFNDTNGNNIYRNLSSAVKAWAWFIDDKYEALNILPQDDFKNLKGFKGSGWSQRLRTISDFGFATSDRYENGKDVELNQTGIDFKELIKEYISSPNTEKITQLDQLKEFNYKKIKDIPLIFKNAYKEQLNKLNPEEGVTAYTKTLLSGLLMAQSGEYVKLDQNIKTTDQEKKVISKYFTVNNYKTKDWKWNVWVADNLKDIGLLKHNESSNKYEVSDEGNNLIDQLIENWKDEGIFGEVLSYEASIKLGRIKFITFHQSYSYEEFIEGIRPNLGEGEKLSYSLEKGVFQKLAEDAKKKLSNNYVIIIDEINRGNISKIFGELITIIEDKKRLFQVPKEHPQEVLLPYSKSLFGVPKNLYIIGTMNTADRSITNIDTALRRRFVFKEFPPINNHELIGKIKKDGIEIELQNVLKVLNQRIEYLLDRDHLIGHSYFMNITTWNELCDVFRNKIIPLLQEYFYNDWENICRVLGDNDSWKKEPNEKFIQSKTISKDKLFGNGNNMEEEYDNKLYYINPHLIDENNYDKLSIEFFAKGFPSETK